MEILTCIVYTPKFVFPHADGNAAQMYRLWDSFASLTPMISICSANQFSFLANEEPKRKAKHFLPNNELPPYPDPKLMISLVWGL